jgi:hypothetical protein
MSFVVLAKQGVMVNWSDVIFSNFYSKLWDLSALTKSNVSKDNIEFKATQMVDILFQDWFLIDPTLILLVSNEDEKIVARLILEV